MTARQRNDPKSPAAGNLSTLKPAASLFSPSNAPQGGVVEETARQQACGAAQSAHSHLTSAIKHLWGRRIPMGGMHYDTRAALTELQLAHQNMLEAIRILQSDVEKE